MHNNNFVVKKYSPVKFQTQTLNINCGLEADSNEHSLSRLVEQRTDIDLNFKRCNQDRDCIQIKWNVLGKDKWDHDPTEVFFLFSHFQRSRRHRLCTVWNNVYLQIPPSIILSTSAHYLTPQMMNN